MDWDINGTMVAHGWSDRSSHRLNPFVIVTNAFKFPFSFDHEH